MAVEIAHPEKKSPRRDFESAGHIPSHQRGQNFILEDIKGHPARYDKSSPNTRLSVILQNLSEFGLAAASDSNQTDARHENLQNIVASGKISKIGGFEFTFLINVRIRYKKRS